MIFASCFDPSRDTKKGYHDTHANWVNYNKSDSSQLHGGPVDVCDKDGVVLEKLWEAMHNVIEFSSDMMRPFLVDMEVKT